MPEEKERNLWWWIPTPYRVMTWYAKRQDHIEDYSKTHAFSAWVFFLLSFVVAYLAFKADYQVLYGIEYAATRDEWESFLSSAFFALVIQFLVIVGGGMAIKLWLWGHTARGTEHGSQYKVMVFLGLMGFFFTGALSWNSPESIRGRQLKAENSLLQHHLENLSKLDSLNNVEVQRINKAYSSDSARACESINAQIDVVRNQHHASNEYRKDRYADDTTRLKKKLNYNAIALKENITPLLQQREQIMKPIHDRYLSNLDIAIRNDTLLRNMEVQRYQTETSEIKQDGALAGMITRWRNLALNLLSLGLTALVLLFARGATNETGITPHGSTIALPSFADVAKKAPTLFTGSKNKGDRVIPPKYEQQVPILVNNDKYIDEDFKHINTSSPPLKDEGQKITNNSYTDDITDNDTTNTHNIDNTSNSYTKHEEQKLQRTVESKPNKTGFTITNLDQQSKQGTRRKESEILADADQIKASIKAKMRKNQCPTLQAPAFDGSVELLGTLDANYQVFWNVDDDALVKVCYRSSKGDIWKTKRQTQQALGSRAARMAKALDKALNTQDETTYNRKIDTYNNNAMWCAYYEWVLENVF